MATTKDENTFEMARKYAMCVVVAGGIPTMLQMTCAQLLRSVGYSRQSGFGMFGLVWAQIVGDIMTDIVSLTWFYSIIKKSEKAIKEGESYE